MDIRDILKSFDNLSEGEKTVTDKGTVHKAGPGEYGNKHGSEDVTDQYGKPIARMSLGKMGLANEPKRGKGRPPNPDKAKSYDSSALSKAMGIGKAPKPTGKPSVKHSLKEYFDQLDQALVEADQIEIKPASQMPKQPGQTSQPGQPQQVAGQPATNTQVIAQGNKTLGTVNNPQLAQQIKQSIGKGEMTLMPGQQMEEDGENWIKGAIKHPGAFTKKASSHGMTPKEFANKVLAHKKDYPAKTEKQAQLAKTLGKMHESQGESPYTLELISSEERDDPEGWSTMNVGTFKVLKNGKEIGTAEWDDYFGNLEIDINGKRQQLKYDSNHPLLKMAKHAVEEPINIAQRAHHGVKEAETPPTAFQSSPLSTNNRGVSEGQGDFGKAIENLHGWNEVEPHEPDTRQFDFDDDEDGYDASGTVVQDLKTGKIKVDFTVNNGYYSNDIHSTFDSIGDAMDALRTITTQKRYSGGKSYSRDTLALKTPVGPDDVYKTDRAGKIGTLNKGRMGNMKASSQYTMRGGPKGVLPEGKKGVNPFAKKDTKKKPDADKDGIPDYAEDGKGPNDTKKKGAAPKKGVNPFAKKTEKKKVKEGMEHHLQAARLEGKSHALRKMPYNCTHDDMEEARCYHDGFKEGLDECYGQMPILGRTAVDEVSPEVGTMASYGAHDVMDEGGNAFTAGLAKTPHGGKFKVGGSTFTDRTSYDSNLDEFAFEAFDSQLKALLESEEKVSEGMTVSISKGQQGAPDSVSVSAQDGEADQLLSIIKSAGMGLFGGDEQNGYGAPQGSTQAPGGIEVVDDHDGMMALMRKLSGGGEMVGGGDYESEEGHGDEGHMHGEEGHSHEGEEDTCNECGYMESKCQCDHGDEQVVDEESRNQMLYNVAEDNPPDNGSANSTNATQGNNAANSALAVADANEDMEEAVDLSPEARTKAYADMRAAAAKKQQAATQDKEDATGEEAGKEELEEGTCKKCDCNPCKCETMSESSFFNLFRKISMLSEESTEKKDEKAEEAGKKVTKDIEYDDKKDKKEKKLDEWANEAGKNGTDASFEADIDFMTKVISGGLNKQKSTGQTTIPVINGQKSRMGVDGLGSPMKESNDLLKDYRKLSGL